MEVQSFLLSVLFHLLSTFVNFACYFAGPIIALGQANDVVVS